MRKKSGVLRHRVSIYLKDATVKQIEALEQVFNLEKSGVISAAIARWFHDEPLANGKSTTKKNKVVIPDKVEGA